MKNVAFDRGKPPPARRVPSGPRRRDAPGFADRAETCDDAAVSPAEVSTMLGSLRPGDSRLAVDLEDCLAGLAREAIPRRIRERDHTVWRPDPIGISDRLGWLGVAGEMPGRLPEIRELVEGLRAESIADVVLVGMGGSSLAPEVFRRILGSAAGHPRLHVLDSTSPARIRRVTDAVEPARTCVIIASKSGTTIEVRTLRQHFREVLARTGRAEDRLIAITDPGTPLASMSSDEGWRRVFLNPPDIGGRFSALSLFGLVPAGILGVNLEGFLERAQRLEAACEDHPAASPGAWLGAVMGAAARGGRDKLVLAPSPSLEPFGLWIEQLVAESTGKDGTGIVPVAGAASARGQDSLVVEMCLAGEEPAPVAGAGTPVVRLDVPDELSLGAEMFRWELATAVAGHVLGVHPFDQPDVQAAKTRTNELLAGLGEQGVPRVAAGDPAELLATVKPGDYVGLMVYGEETRHLVSALGELREAIAARHDVAVTVGFGPRFLHSTGQLHKGGPSSGIFLQWLLEEGELPVPGEPWGFHDLIAAQAGGDLEALRDAGRRVMRVAAGPDPVASIRALAAAT
jgi:glucose-6-phosphate isomerase